MDVQVALQVRVQGLLGLPIWPPWFAILGTRWMLTLSLGRFKLDRYWSGFLLGALACAGTYFTFEQNDEWKGADLSPACFPSTMRLLTL